MTQKLSVREQQVLQLIADENTNREIAQKLFISHHTADTHRKHLLGKLSARNSAGLVRRGFELGLLSVDNQAPSHQTKIIDYDMLGHQSLQRVASDQSSPGQKLMHPRSSLSVAGAKSSASF